MSSIWQDSSTRQPHAPLSGNISADVAVIGGGMSGILTAYFLKQKGASCVILEAGQVGMGVSVNTTAKVTAQHGLIYDRLLRQFGTKKACEYLSKNLLAVEKYRKLCADIDCDWRELSSFVYSHTSADEITREAQAINMLGGSSVITNRVPMPIQIEQAISMPHQGLFNPIKFLEHISKNLCIYENTRALSVKNHTITTDNGSVLAKDIVICTHFPFINMPGLYFAKMYQSRAYTIAMRGAQDVGGMYLDSRENGFSFRNYGDLLLICGGDHRTGKRGGGMDVVKDYAKLLYPNAVITHSWATQDCMSLDSIPYIGKYSLYAPHMYVATGFNKWGMSSSMVAAQMLSDMIVAGKNNYDSIFNSRRFSLGKQFFINGVETASAMLSLSVKRCSHLGCALKYNKDEHTWDCPCHGSRFDVDGTLINNPAIHPCTTIREDFKNG